MNPVQLYRHFDKDDKLLYVGVSRSADFRLVQHQRESSWGPRIVRMTVEEFDSRVEAVKAERIAITSENPIYNQSRPNSRHGTANISVHLPSMVRVQLKELAAREQTTIADLVGEGLNLVFAKRGLPDVVPIRDRKIRA